MNTKYWARFNQDGTLQSFVGETVGPWFFENAKSDKVRVARVVVVEVPLTKDEQAQVDGVCPSCGRATPEGRSS